MQKLARTFFDFSMGNIQVVELLSVMEWTQNLSGKVVELLSETEGTQNLSGNFCLFEILVWSRPFDILVSTADD